MQNQIDKLQPREVWQHFQAISQIPRPTFHEAAIREYLQAWADSLNLKNQFDAIGNLHIYKPAHAANKSSERVILQAHVDMVAQQTSDSEHDFLRDPLDLQIDGDWIFATGTTLGADDGIGVAAAMAVLASSAIVHPELQVIFTVEEETGMGGAKNLQRQDLAAKYLLNLDSEDAGDVYIGCAGGIDVNARAKFNAKHKQLPCYELQISGLAGGHSGLDIHKNKLSAATLSAQLLSFMGQKFKFRLVSLECGNMRNAIARDAYMVLALNARKLPKFKRRLKKFIATLTPNLHADDQNLQIKFKQVNLQKPKSISVANSVKLARLLLALPQGVAKAQYSPDLQVMCSNNIGILKLKNGKFSCKILVRASQNELICELRDKIVATFNLAAINADSSGFYSSWRPQADSELLPIFQASHKQLFKREAAVKVMHAGLECAIIGSKNPDLEMISFGPNIKGAHSPQERMQISSVKDFWRLLVKVLNNLAA